MLLFRILRCAMTASGLCMKNIKYLDGLALRLSGKRSGKSGSHLPPASCKEVSNGKYLGYTLTFGYRTYMYPVT